MGIGFFVLIKIISIISFEHFDNWNKMFDALFHKWTCLIQSFNFVIVVYLIAKICLQLIELDHGYRSTSKYRASRKWHKTLLEL